MVTVAHHQLGTGSHRAVHRSSIYHSQIRVVPIALRVLCDSSLLAALVFRLTTLVYLSSDSSRTFVGDRSKFVSEFSLQKAVYCLINRTKY